MILWYLENHFTTDTQIRQTNTQSNVFIPPTITSAKEKIMALKQIFYSRVIKHAMVKDQSS